MNKDYIDKVANSIIEQLEQGTAPWLKPWEPGQLRLPFNPTTGKEYRGMNSLWLHMQGKDDPRWLTFNQGKAEGASVRKGEKGTHIVYWKFTEERTLKGEDGRPVIDEATGKEKKITVKLDRPRSFTAVVFNGSQFDGLPPLEARPQRDEPERHALAEKILENSGAKITHVDGDRAFYSPARDSITLPARNQFPTADNYYATALHELGHWTGHPSRLDRDLSHPFGSEGYAREELRAEISSLMLGERMDIGHDPGQHAAYVGSWIKALKEDPREIFRAAADAERIAGFVMGFENEQAQTVERQPAPQVAAPDRETVTPEAAALLKEIDDRTFFGVSPLNRWQMMQEEAASLGYTARLDTGLDPDNPNIGAFVISYDDPEGAPTQIQTELFAGPEGIMHTAFAGELISPASNDENGLRGTLRDAVNRHEQAAFDLRWTVEHRDSFQTDPDWEPIGVTNSATQALARFHSLPDTRVIDNQTGEVAARTSWVRDGSSPEWTPSPELVAHAAIEEMGASLPARPASMSQQDYQLAEAVALARHYPEPEAFGQTLLNRQIQNATEAAFGESVPGIRSGRLPEDWTGEARARPVVVFGSYEAGTLDDRDPEPGEQPTEWRIEIRHSDQKWDWFANGFTADEADQMVARLNAVANASQPVTAQQQHENAISPAASTGAVLDRRFDELSSREQALFMGHLAEFGGIEPRHFNQALESGPDRQLFEVLSKANQLAYDEGDDYLYDPNEALAVTRIDANGMGRGVSSRLIGFEQSLAAKLVVEEAAPQTEPFPRDPREIPEDAQFPQNWGGMNASFTRDTPRPDSTVSRQQAVAEADAVLHHRPENPMPNRTYLAVPYAEKEQAKAAAKNAGFKLQWDKDAKSWYAPEGADLSTMQKWNPDSSRVITETAPDSPQVQLADALRDAGFELKRGQWLNGNRVGDSEPVMDGQLYRVPVKGDRDGQRSGAYAAHMQGQVPGAYIENLKTGERINWKADGPVEQLTAEDRARLAKEAQERQSVRDEATQRRYEATADAAAALWAESPTATADNAYCKAKGITNPVGLRVVPDEVSPETAAKGIVIAKTAKEAKEQREKNPDARVFKAGDLLIPGRDMDGKMWTLQSVNPYFKSLMKGGRKHGLFSVAGADADGKPIDGILKSANQSLVLAEGYATADTVARLSGEPVIAAFDSGNLNAVAGGLRERFPNAPMVIAADNDHDAPNRTLPNGQPGVNVGLVKAKEAAERHGAGVAAPAFPKGDKGTDWNDVEKARGENDARKMLAEQMAIAKRDAAVNAERMTMLARERDMEARNDPTTSADDADIATERSRAASLIAAASDQKTAVNSTAANAMATGTKAPSASAAKAATDRQTGAMRDTVKQERQDVQYDADNDDKTPAKPAARPRVRRSRGHDAGM